MLLIGMLAVLAGTGAQTGSPARYDARDFGIAYIVTATTTVRTTPTATSKEVGQVKRFDLPRVIEARTGWAHILVVPPEGSSAKEYDGWIEVSATDAKAHLADSLDAALRIVTVRRSTWLVTIQNGGQPLRGCCSLSVATRFRDAAEPQMRLSWT